MALGVIGTKGTSNLRSINAINPRTESPKTTGADTKVRVLLACNTSTLFGIKKLKKVRMSSTNTVLCSLIEMAKGLNRFFEFALNGISRQLLAVWSSNLQDAT